jgi:16S rRNA (guanine966-N2)-methyltransferase
MAETRITAGEWRGRLIDTPRGSRIRPTRSLVRQALFNILGDSVVDARFLDLFAGAGSVGFEALSRGAASVTFVDSSRESLALVTATAERLGAQDRSRLVHADVLRWLRSAGPEVGEMDICFVDAPYQDPALDRVLRQLAISPPTLIVCEHHHKRTLAERIGPLHRVREVRHGLTSLSFLQPTMTTTAGGHHDE